MSLDNLDELLDDLAVRKSYGSSNRVASSRVDLDELENLMNDLKGEPESTSDSRPESMGGSDLDDLMNSLGASSGSTSIAQEPVQQQPPQQQYQAPQDDLDSLMNSLTPETHTPSNASREPSYGGGDDLDSLMNSLTPVNSDNYSNNNSGIGGGDDLDNLMNSLTPSLTDDTTTSSNGMKSDDIFDLLGGSTNANNNSSNNNVGMSNSPQQSGPAGETNLSDLETDILMELQRLRSDPSFYANLLEQRMKPAYKGKWLVMQTDSKQLVQMETVEGISACDEAIQVLKQIGSIGSISHGKGLSDAAREAVIEHGKYGEMKSTALERLMNYGKFEGQASEMVSYGVYSAQEVIMQHIISDGDQNRGNRKTLLDHQKRYCGIGVGEHKSQYQRMYSLVFCQDWMDWAMVK